MQFDYRSFHIDCRARHDDTGQYVARAKIAWAGPRRASAPQQHDSGDICHFDSESDAISCARSWAIEWCDGHAPPR